MKRLLGFWMPVLAVIIAVMAIINVGARAITRDRLDCEALGGVQVRSHQEGTICIKAERIEVPR